MNEHDLNDDLRAKWTALRRLMRGCGSALVAFSGGVDSALVMAVAHRELGERALACIGVSPSYPTRELQSAVALAEAQGWPYRLIHPQEFRDPRYVANAGDRCYFCKSALHDTLRALAAAEGWKAVLDGNNADDLGDYRPGMAAARERGVRSPLLEVGLTKAEVRQLARWLGLPVWDKPAMACLASRVPQGTPVTPSLLRQIEQAEDALAALGFRQFRVRHHGDIARIELPVADLPRAVALREAIVAGVQAAGYRFVALDLAGFRSGSLNPAVGPQPIPLASEVPS